MEAQTLEKRRQRFHVEINRKRVSEVVMNSRARHSQIPQAALVLIDQATKFQANHNDYGFEKLMEEFMQGDSGNQAQQIVQQLLIESDSTRLSACINILRVMYQKDDITLPTAQLFSRLVVLDHQTYIQALGLMSVVFIKDKISCLSTIECGLLDKVLARMHAPGVQTHTLNVFQNMCVGIQVMSHIQNYERSIVRLLGSIFKAFNQTHNVEYLKVLRQALEDIDNDDITLSLIEDYMKDLDDCFQQLHSTVSHPANIEIMKLLDLLLMSQDIVIETFLKCGFVEYIMIGISSNDYKVKTQAINCMDSIMFSGDKDIIEFVQDSDILETLAQLADSTFSSYSIINVNMEHALLKALSSSFNNYELIFDWKMFISSCSSRLQCVQLQYNCLALLNDLANEKEYSRIVMEQHGVLKIVERLSCQAQTDDVRKEAARLL